MTFYPINYPSTNEYPSGRDMKVYSERGLLSYYSHEVLINNPQPMLNEARNANNISLAQIIGDFKKYTVYTEFSLGSVGFGSPDGALWTKAEHSCFIFINGKIGR